MPIFNDITNFLILGDSEEATMAKDNGETLSEIVKKIARYWFDFELSPLNSMTFGLAAKYNFGPHLSKLKKTQEKAESIIKKIYEYRVKKL